MGFTVCVCCMCRINDLVSGEILPQNHNQVHLQVLEKQQQQQLQHQEEEEQQQQHNHAVM